MADAKAPAGSIEALTAALVEVVEVTRQHNAILTQMMDKAGGTATTKPTTTKPTTTKTETAPKVTAASLKAEIGEWLGASPKGSAESDAKKESLRKILEAVGAGKVTEIEAGKIAEANALFQQVKAGEDPFPAEETGDDLL